MTTKLPESFYKENREILNGAKFYGVPIEEMDRDDLLAIIGWFSENERKRQERDFPERALLGALRSHLAR